MDGREEGSPHCKRAFLGHQNRLYGLKVLFLLLSFTKSLCFFIRVLVSKLSSVSDSEEEMPFSFPDSYIPTVTKIIIGINGGNKLLDHQLSASSRAGKASKITQYHDCISKGKYINPHSQLTKSSLHT